MKRGIVAGPCAALLLAGLLASTGGEAAGAPPARRAAAPARRETSDPRARRVDSLFVGLDRTPAPGVAFAVVRDGKVILRRAYGYADLPHRVPITTSTVFDIASLAKHFTGFAVGTLVEEKRLDLGDDIRARIPEMHDLPQAVTVQQLLHHTSGVRDWFGSLSIAGWRPDDPIRMRDILTLACAQRSLNFTPGTEHLYSNTGYNLLAELVQRTTGQTLRAWLDEHVFHPLGMAHTQVRDDWREVIPDQAFAYARAPDGSWRAVPDLLAAPGSSSVFSTVDDLALWLLHIDRETTAGSPVFRAMERSGTLTDGTTVGYGYGMTVGRWRGLDMVTANGGWAGYQAFLVYLPARHYGMIALANSVEPRFDPQSLVIAVSQIYLEKELEPEAAAAREESAAPAPPSGETAAGKGADSPAATTTADRPSPFRATDYAGWYDSEELGTSYHVIAKGDTLQLEHRRRAHMVLMQQAQDRFTTRDAFFRSVVFERDPAGRVSGFVVNGDARSRDIRFVKRS